MHLKENDLLYHDITFDLSEVRTDLLTFVDEPIDFRVNCSNKEPESLNDDKTRNPFHNFRQPCNQLLL